MTDPVTAAARRQNTIDAIADELIGWGCPDDYALPRARHLLDVVAAFGWSLPAALLDVPPHRGPGSTDDGRAAARRVWEAARRTREAATVADDALDDVARMLQRTTGGPQHAQERLAASTGPRVPDRPHPSRDRTVTLPKQERSCMWAHGHLPDEVLDEHGLCPVCAAD